LSVGGKSVFLAPDEMTQKWKNFLLINSSADVAFVESCNKKYAKNVSLEKYDYLSIHCRRLPDEPIKVNYEIKTFGLMK
jgi:hypothetical protein